MSTIFHCGDKTEGPKIEAEWPKIEAEGRERGGAAGPLPTSYWGLGSAVSSPAGLRAEPRVDRPKVFHYFQRSEWPLLTLWTIMQPLGARPRSPCLDYAPATHRRACRDRVLGPVDEVSQVVVVAVVDERLHLENLDNSTLHVGREDECQDAQGQLGQQQHAQNARELNIGCAHAHAHTREAKAAYTLVDRC